jgi:hypothetical protein
MGAATFDRLELLRTAPNLTWGFLSGTEMIRLECLIDEDIAKVVCRTWKSGVIMKPDLECFEALIGHPRLHQTCADAFRVRYALSQFVILDSEKLFPAFGNGDSTQPLPDHPAPFSLHAAVPLDGALTIKLQNKHARKVKIQAGDAGIWMGSISASSARATATVNRIAVMSFNPAFIDSGLHDKDVFSALRFPDGRGSLPGKIGAPIGRKVFQASSPRKRKN